MGLFSKSETAAEKQMAQEQITAMLKQEYMKTQVEIARQQMNNVGMADSAAYQNAASGLRPGGFLMNAGMAGQISTSQIANTAFTGTIAGSKAKPRFDPNKHPATQMALSALVDLWRAKYGDTWVDCMAPVEEGDTFWPAGSARLERNGKLEKYDDGSTWLRIKEDA